MSRTNFEFLLSHLSCLSVTLDGNHHANRYAKNSDPKDTSLLGGHAYFPEISVYKEHVKNIPNTKEVSSLFISHAECSPRPQKSVCNSISAVNFQDRKKFIGMDETGLIIVNCRHGIVMSSVDMYYGER